jgi:hypothetical protein
MAADETQFHDPELKAAVISARGGHTASPDLRAKVLQRMAEVRTELDASGGSNGQPTSLSSSQVPLMRLAGTDADDAGSSLKMKQPARRPWYLRPTFFAAAAAILIVAIGGSSYYNHLQHEAEEREEYLENNRPLLLAMIDAFNGKCDTDPNRQVINDTSDPRALSQELTKRLGRDVPPVNMKGWTVESISICQVGPAQAAHWHLNKNGRKMTVLSLPKQAFNIEEYEDYDFKLNGHEIAGFLRHGSINCIVCDPAVGNREAIRLRDELKRG